MTDISNFISAVGQLLTKRGSVFTPLLTLNGLVSLISYAVYLDAKTLWVFLPELFILIYTLYQHEFFARTKPHMLSTESIQRTGMMIDAGAMGESSQVLTQDDIDVMKPTEAKPESTEALTEGTILNVQDVGSKDV